MGARGCGKRGGGGGGRDERGAIVVRGRERVTVRDHRFVDGAPDALESLQRVGERDLSAQVQIEARAELARILDREVHALARDRMNAVRGVAEQHGVALVIAVEIHPPERNQRERGARADRGHRVGALVADEFVQAREQFRARRVGEIALHLVGGKADDEARRLVADRIEVGEPLVRVDVQPVAFAHAVGERDRAERHRRRVRHALGRHAQHVVADHRARAVGAHQPGGRDALAVAQRERRHRAVGVPLDALDRRFEAQAHVRQAVELREQQTAQLLARYQDEVAERAGAPVVERRDRRLVVVQPHRVAPEAAGGEYVVEQPHCANDADAGRLQQIGAVLRAVARRALDHRDAVAPRAEQMRKRDAGDAATVDQYIDWVVFHGGFD